MKIFGLVLVSRISDTKVLKCAFDLSSFGYFSRNTAKDCLLFLSQELIERTNKGERQSVKQNEYLCNSYLSTSGLGAVMICDNEYKEQRRVAFTLLDKLVNLYLLVYPDPSQWNANNQFRQIDEYLIKYQNPYEADALLKIQTDLNETEIIMRENMDALLKRGEKLTDLIDRTDRLDATAKIFLKTAHKANQCNCIIL